jgi:AraC family transcriptional regulator, regulatory protein of adaptative response / methylated-DNA-[protein]-cysteine methyltransferase
MNATAEDEIRFVTDHSTLGLVLIGQTAAGLCAVMIGEDADILRRELQSQYPGARLTDGDIRENAAARRVIRSIDRGEQDLETPLDLRGTEFQKIVWKTLRTIPAGKTTTYADLARRIGRPRAVRAVAHACARNALAVIVPCHRVIRSDGHLAGYRWGIERKKALLEIEGA